MPVEIGFEVILKNALERLADICAIPKVAKATDVRQILAEYLVHQTPVGELQVRIRAIFGPHIPSEAICDESVVWRYHAVFVVFPVKEIFVQPTASVPEQFMAGFS